MSNITDYSYLVTKKPESISETKQATASQIPATETVIFSESTSSKKDSDVEIKTENNNSGTFKSVEDIRFTALELTGGEKISKHIDVEIEKTEPLDKETIEEVKELLEKNDTKGLSKYKKWQIETALGKDSEEYKKYEKLTLGDFIIEHSDGSAYSLASSYSDSEIDLLGLKSEKKAKIETTRKQSLETWAKDKGFSLLGDSSESKTIGEKICFGQIEDKAKATPAETISKSVGFLTVKSATIAPIIKEKVSETKKSELAAQPEETKPKTTVEETKIPKANSSKLEVTTETENKTNEASKSITTNAQKAETKSNTRYISKEELKRLHRHAVILHYAKNNINDLIKANLSNLEIETVLKDTPELFAQYKSRKSELAAQQKKQEEVEIQRAKEERFIAKLNKKGEALAAQDKANEVESTPEQSQLRVLNLFGLESKAITIPEASENIVNISLKETPKAAASGDDNIVKHSLTNASKMRTADFKNAKEVVEDNQQEELFIAQGNSVNKAQEKTHEILNKYYPNYNEEAKNKHLEITKKIANKEIEDLKKDTLNSNLSKEEVNKRLEFLESKKEEVRITAIKIHNEFVCNVQTKSNKKIKNITKQENKKQEDIKENKENSYTEKEKLEKKNKKLSYILNMILATIKNLKNKPHKDVVNNKAQLDTAQNLKNHLEQKLADNNAQIRLYDLSINNDNLNRDLSLIKISNSIAVETAITNSVIFS